MDHAKPKPRRIKPHSPEWRRMAYELLCSYAPPVYPCAHCGAPVLRGYCCEHCGSDSPEHK